MHIEHFNILTVLRKIAKFKDQTRPNESFFAAGKK